MKKLNYIAMTASHNPQSTLDMQYAQDVMDAIKRLSLSELHTLRLSGISMDAPRFFGIINVAINRFAALKDKSL